MIHLKARLVADVATGGVDAVKDALQQAIELEHATIPVYLYSLYSLDPAKNGVIAGIIESVVVEEMLHMTLACNILNALGGSPVIDKPDFIPNYPGPLPGGVESGLTVHLAPFSKDQVEKVFMEIEEPEHPIPFGTLAAAARPVTIGMFYTTIKKKIQELGDGVFSSTPRNQVPPSATPPLAYPFTSDPFAEVVVVTDVASASQAIDTIIEQGEGTSSSPEESVGSDEPAHYYRFAEIVKGRRLIENPNAPPGAPVEERYIYGGDPIPFDPTGVYAVPSDPKTATYPAGSVQRKACETFNYTYTSLLTALHATFNGQPDQLNDSIGLMMSLKGLAQSMMSGGVISDEHIGPSFEYQPVNPT